MHLNSIIFILTITYSFSETLSVKKNSRVRRAEPTFIETKCIVIDSTSKERCTTTTREHSIGHIEETQSCVVDEKFRVKYQTKDGHNVISTIETFGHQFPRLMKEGDIDKCYYNPTNPRTVRWTPKSEDYGIWAIILMLVIFGIMLMVAIGCFISNR